MQDNSRGAGDEEASPTAAQDARDQRVVPTHVLALHPTHLILPQLVQAIAGGSEDFAEGDNIERAVRDLTGVGLLHRPGGLVMPTPAALRFNEVLGG